jgi:hypothetical protein
MVFTYNLDFQGLGHQHKILESLLEKAENPVRIQESITVNEEDISF